MAAILSWLQCVNDHIHVLHKVCIRENLLGHSQRISILYCLYQREWQEFKCEHICQWHHSEN